VRSISAQKREMKSQRKRIKGKRRDFGCSQSNNRGKCKNFQKTKGTKVSSAAGGPRLSGAARLAMKGGVLEKSSNPGETVRKISMNVKGNGGKNRDNKS